MATPAETLKPSPLLPTRGPTFWAIAWRVVRRRPGRMLGLIIVTIFTLMAIFGPMLYPANLPIDPAHVYAAPSWAHPFGTDFEGTDNLALIVTGSRYVLFAALMAALFHVVFGTSAGLASGYLGGWVDTILMRAADFILTIPSFPLLVVLSIIWKFGQPVSMGFVLGIIGWGGLARAVRSQTLSLRERGFIEAARGLGLPTWHIIFKEILPNVMSYIAMNLLTSITYSIYTEVGLFFLGVLPFTANNWGVMLNLAVFSAGAITTTKALPYLLSPLVCILLLTLGIVLLLDGVDELFNPRLRGA
jgi:peptide/nickel transport system permease protein